MIDPVALQWDKLQKMVVARCGGHDHTIHDSIDYSAHVAGGVHLTAPRHARQQALADLHASRSGTGLSPVASIVRAIGRVVLSGLYELKDQALGVARFEGGPGLSVYAIVFPARMAGGEENYIIDIGSDPSRNRVPIFLDAHGDLCPRVFDLGGVAHQLRAGPAGGAHVYGEPMILACEIGFRGTEALVNVDARDWSLTRVYRGSGGPAFDDSTPVVVGSDVTGRCRSRMHGEPASGCLTLAGKTLPRCRSRPQGELRPATRTSPPAAGPATAGPRRRIRRTRRSGRPAPRRSEPPSAVSDGIRRPIVYSWSKSNGTPLRSISPASVIGMLLSRIEGRLPRHDLGDAEPDGWQHLTTDVRARVIDMLMDADRHTGEAIALKKG